MIRLPSVQTQQQGREHLKLNHSRRILLHFRRQTCRRLISKTRISYATIYHCSLFSSTKAIEKNNGRKFYMKYIYRVRGIFVNLKKKLILSNLQILKYIFFP